jgi:hypothetical protein
MFKIFQKKNLLEITSYFVAFPILKLASGRTISEMLAISTLETGWLSAERTEMQVFLINRINFYCWKARNIIF